MATIDPFDRLHDRLDRIEDKVTEQGKTLAAQHATLVEHTRRSEALEEIVAHDREGLQAVEADVSKVKFLGQILAWGGSGILAVYEVLKASGVLK